MLSYFPPTTETMAATQLNESIKVVKKLKKEGVLKYKGHLICNISLDEYLKGGKGYHDSLQISLQKKIDESVKRQYAEQNLFKNVGVQLAYLLKHNYVKITFVDNKIYSSKNLYMIKNIQWTAKIKTALILQLELLYQNYITPIATQENDDSYRNNNISDFLNLMKKIGAIDMFFKCIDLYINKLLVKLKEANVNFEALDKVEKNVVENIIENKTKKIDNENKLDYIRYSDKTKKDNNK